jgi:hypothetical protein
MLENFNVEILEIKYQKLNNRPTTTATAAATTTTISSSNSIKFFIICVLSQQLQGQLQTQHSVNTKKQTN